MRAYALFDLSTGYVMGITPADDPVDACRRLDAKIGCAGRRYRDVGLHAPERAVGYAVYELRKQIPEALDDASGNDPALIEWIEDNGDLRAVCIVEDGEA